MKSFKKIAAFAPILSVVMVGTCIGVSLMGYEAPVYKVQAFENDSMEAAKEDETEKDNNDKPEKESENNADLEIEKGKPLDANGKFELEDGIYEGSGTGFSGTVKVAVQIKDKRIVKIEIISNEDDAAFFNRAKGVTDSIIAAQSTDVDVVSGATYSSRGIIEAVNNALNISSTTSRTAFDATGNTFENAGKNQDNTSSDLSAAIEVIRDDTNLKDGTYYGTGVGFAGDLTVKVVIENGRIADISIVSTNDGDEFIEKASFILTEIVNRQSLNVDTVSGATYSSRGIIEAAANAVSQAIISQSDSTDIFDGYDIGDNANKNNAEKNSEHEGNKNSDISHGASDVVPKTPGNIPYDDGIYYGTGEGFSGEVKVSVEIKDHTITAIKVISMEDDEMFFNRAIKLTDDIVKKQTTDVDTVSGATFSSEGIIEAVNNALEQAKNTTADSGNNSNADEKSNAGEKSGTDENSNTGERETDNTNDTGDKSNDGKKNQDDEKKSNEQDVIDDKNTDEKNLDEDKENENKDNENKDRGAGKENGEEDNTDKENEDKEKETAGKNVYKDGTYFVKVPCIPDEDEMFDEYNLSMNITIQSDKIVNITDVEGDGAASNNSYIKKALRGTSKLIGMIEKMTGISFGTEADENIDTVSGATCTSKSMIEGCKDAFKKAKEEKDAGERT